MYSSYKKTASYKMLSCRYITCISSLSTKSSLNLLFCSYDTYMTFTLFLCITFFFLSRIVDWKIKQIDVNFDVGYALQFQWKQSGSLKIFSWVLILHRYVFEFCIWTLLSKNSEIISKTWFSGCQKKSRQARLSSYLNA